ncbi:MAG: hypothetical protein PHU14_03825 [Methylovulum sp.]|nr:hypothetical protein [Methylovulum sp.]
MNYRTGFTCCLVTVACTFSVSVAVAKTEKLLAQNAHIPREPFLASNGLKPPASEYSGPFFKLSHKWPDQPLPALKDAPWTKAVKGGRITTDNAAAYVAALKDYVGPNARELMLHYDKWDADTAHWYNEPWLGSIRESIHGTYAGGQFTPSIFPGTGLKTTFDTHVLTYYDERAAYSLHKVWGKTAMLPAIKTENFQFEEGSVVVKAALFVSDDPTVQSDWWPVIDGAAKWPLYLAIPESTPGATQVVNGYVMQFDIIVKDSVAAPKTGWVFSTLVYDTSASGDAWDKMVPLGVMWGNDPDVDSSKQPPPPLNENWINPKAPLYSTQTLGWGGRLSGPNDGGRNNIQVGDKAMDNEPDSSCMSCHGPAEWQPKQHKMLSFLLPSYPNPNPGPPFKPCPDGKPSDAYICSPAPGSADWSKWFKDRPGTEPQDPDTGSIATDYDMVFAFKSLPLWWKAVGPANLPMPFTLFQLKSSAQDVIFNQYTGAPLKPTK